MFPEGFIKRIHNQKYIDAGSLLKALGKSSPASIRINPFKWNKPRQIQNQYPGPKMDIILAPDHHSLLILFFIQVVITHR
jgi:hypothetical protein